MLRPLLSERARKDHHATPAPHPLLPRVGLTQQNRGGGKKDFEEDSPPNSFMTQLWRNGNVNSGEMCGLESRRRVHGNLFPGQVGVALGRRLSGRRVHVRLRPPQSHTG